MPYLELSAEHRLFYEIDDYTDAWKKAEAVVMIHGFTENTDAYRAWVPHLARNYRVMGQTALATAHVYLRWVSTIDVAKDLHKVKCPVLVLTTTTPRRAYSRTDVELYRESLPQAEIAAIPVDGYHVSGTAPDQSARITLDFLKRHSEDSALSDAGA